LVRNNSIRPSRWKNRTVHDEQELKKLEVFVPAGYEFTGRQIVDIQWPHVHQPVILPKIGAIALSSPSAAPSCPAEEFRRTPRQNLLRKTQLMKKRKSCNLEMKMTLETINDEELAAKRAEPAPARSLLPRIAGQHLSSLRRKILKLSGDQPASACLRQLAVNRGCRHYEGTFEPPSFLPTGLATLTDEELAVALCLIDNDNYPLNVRIAAQLIGAKGVSAEKLALLAEKERCASVIAHIANAGKKVEPTNPFWSDVLKRLPKRNLSFPPLLPHWTRFVSMTGITRKGGNHTEWLHPCALP
jgi:hypothetical protein